MGKYYEGKQTMDLVELPTNCIVCHMLEGFVILLPKLWLLKLVDGHQNSNLIIFTQSTPQHSSWWNMFNIEWIKRTRQEKERKLLLFFVSFSSFRLILFAAKRCTVALKVIVNKIEYLPEKLSYARYFYRNRRKICISNFINYRL